MAGEANAETRFEIGSITKVFTSLLLADMVLAGEVSLDDPVTDYLPDGALAKAPGITLRMLARHTSGLANTPYNILVGGSGAPLDHRDPYAGFDEAALFDWMRTVEPEAAPDAEWQYSNAGMALLGYALAQAAGEDYRSLLIERIVAPMGLSETGFAKDDLVTAFASGEPAAPWNLAMLAPAGALVSDIDDMVAFARILADPPARWRRHVDLLAADPIDATGEADIGLGFLQIAVGEQRFYVHDGGTGGFRTALWVEPATDSGAVVLLNSMDTDANRTAMWMLRRSRP